MPLTSEVLSKYPAFWFIETGTHAGQAIEIAYRLNFEGIVSIELDRHLAGEAIKKYMDTDNVWIFQGDSADLLAGILNLKEDSVTFWLDAHGPGNLDVKNCPLLQELRSIVEYSKSYKVNILIDDLRLMSKELLESITLLISQVPGFVMTYEDSPIQARDILAVAGEPE